MLNKKADIGDQAMFVWFLFMMIVVGLSVVAGVFIFFGSGYEYRDIDAGLLNSKIQDCIFNEGLFNDIEKIGEDFYKKCGFDKNSINENFIVLIKNADTENVLLQIGSNFESCFFEKKSESFVRCSKENIYFNNKKFEIVTGSNQKSRRINIQ